MTLIERLAAAHSAITGEGALVGRLRVGTATAEAEGIHATSFDLGFASVEVESVPGEMLALEKIVTQLVEV